MRNKHVLAVSAACCICALPAATHAGDNPSLHPSFSVLLENDSFFSEDSSYTGGFSFTYETDDLHKYPEDSKLLLLSSVRQYLPGFDSTRKERLSLSLNGLVFTPENISTPEPVEGDTLYAGVLVTDTEFSSRNTIDQHTYTLRLGWVGPSSQMGNLQESVHDLTSSEDPQGWDSQLPDEPVVNIAYNYARRLKTGDFDNGWHWDMTPSIGASAGTYFTGANASLLLRVGRNMSNSYGTTNIDNGVNASRNIVDAPGGEWRYEFSAGVAAFAIAHYLPLDGTVFKDSSSVEHDDAIYTGSLGFAVGRNSMQMNLLYNVWSDFADGDVQYGGINFTWFLN